MKLTLTTTAISIVVISSIAYQSYRTNTEPKLPLVHLYCDTDVSGRAPGRGFRSNLPQCVTIECSVVRHLVPQHDRISAYSTANTTTQWYENTAPASVGDFRSNLVHELARLPDADNTHSILFFQSIAGDVKGDPAIPVIVHFGDFDEDTIPPARASELLLASARTIASNPRAIVILEGISPKNVAFAKRSLKPLGTRLFIEPATAISSDSVCRWIDAARAQAGKE